MKFFSMYMFLYDSSWKRSQTEYPGGMGVSFSHPPHAYWWKSSHGSAVVSMAPNNELAACKQPLDSHLGATGK